MSSAVQEEAGKSTFRDVETYQIAEYVDTRATPDMIDFGVGQPSPSLLPIEEVTRSLTSQTNATSEMNVSPLVLQYGTSRGYPSFLRDLASFLSREYAFHVLPSELMLTNGNSHAISLVCRALTSPGDTVAMETPSYFLASDIFKSAHVNIVSVGVDSDGLCVEQLEKQLLQDDAFRPKLVYTIPVHHNPTGVCLSRKRARHLYRLSSEFDFIIVADEPYVMLGAFGKSRNSDTCDGSKRGASACPDDSSDDGPLQTSLASVSVTQGDTNEGKGAKGRVISLGTFSKILGPALRLGWLHVPSLKTVDNTAPAVTPAGDLLERICQYDGALASGGGYNSFMAYLIHPMIKPIDSDTPLERHIRSLRATLASRCHALCNAMTELLGAVATNDSGGARGDESEYRYYRPDGGYFIWLTIPTVGHIRVTQPDPLRRRHLIISTCAHSTTTPQAIDTTRLLEVSSSKFHVAFCPGRKCLPCARCPDLSSSHNCLRVSFAFYNNEELREGVRRLKMAIETYKHSYTLANK